MKKKTLTIIFLIISIFLIFMLTACDDDDNVPLPEQTENFAENIIFPSISGLSFKNSSYSEENGGTVYFSVQDNYGVKDNFDLLINGEKLIPKNGLYKISGVDDRQISIAFDGAYDDKFEITAKDIPDGAAVVIDENEVYYGQAASFEVKLNVGYENSDIKVYANDSLLTRQADGKYIIPEVVCNQDINISGIDLNKYDLKYNSGDHGTVVGKAIQSLTHGQASDEVIAVPDENYEFSIWSDGVTTAKRTDTAYGNSAVTAYFSIKTFNVSTDGADNYKILRITDKDTEIITEESKIDYGSSFYFTVDLAEKYSQSKISVSINGHTAIPSEGIYGVQLVDSDMAISVSGLSLNKYDVGFADIDGVEYIYDNNTSLSIEHGGSFSFSIEISDNFSASEYKVTANNKVLILNSNKYTIDNISENITVAVLNIETNLCKISFDTDGGYTLLDKYYRAGDLLDCLPNAVKNDYLFTGWTLNGNDFTENEVFTITNDITFKAKYLKASPLSYNYETAHIIGSTDGKIIVPDIHGGKIIETLNIGNNYSGDISEIITGDNITKIEGSLSYNQAKSLQSVVFSKNLTVLSDLVFLGCSLLQKVYIPSDNLSIGRYCFQDCTSLEEITISGVTEISNRAFVNCTSLERVNLGNKLTKIGEYAFFGTKISSITLPSTIVEIGDYAFTQSNIAEILLPACLKTVGKGAFSTLNELKSINFEDGSNCTLGERAFADCNALTNVTIPTGITLPSGAFAGCSSLYKAEVGNLSEDLFSSCTSLAEVVVTSPITSFPKKVFIGNNVLANIDYPKSSIVEEIGDEAFRNAGIRLIGSFDLTIYGSSLKRIGKYAFYQSGLGKIEIDTNASLSIDDYAFYSCLKANGFTIPKNTVFIGDYAYSGTNWDLIKGNIHLPSGLKHIGAYAFAQKDISKVVFPAEIEYIGDFAFGALQKLDVTQVLDAEMVFLGNSVPLIGENAFGILMLEGYSSGTITVKVPTEL